jgi:superfamily II DNA helicase RecQ
MSLPRATLAKVAAARPASPEALTAIQGVGPQKAERFGAVFLSLIATHGRER